MDRCRQLQTHWPYTPKHEIVGKECPAEHSIATALLNRNDLNNSDTGTAGPPAEQKPTEPITHACNCCVTVHNHWTQHTQPNPRTSTRSPAATHKRSVERLRCQKHIYTHMHMHMLRPAAFGSANATSKTEPLLTQPGHSDSSCCCCCCCWHRPKHNAYACCCCWHRPKHTAHACCCCCWHRPKHGSLLLPQLPAQPRHTPTACCCSCCSCCWHRQGTRC